MGFGWLQVVNSLYLVPTGDRSCRTLPLGLSLELPRIELVWLWLYPLALTIPPRPKIKFGVFPLFYLVFNSLNDQLNCYYYFHVKAILHAAYQVMGQLVVFGMEDTRLTSIFFISHTLFQLMLSIRLCFFLAGGFKTT